jgi:hypothetical protein
MTSSRSESAYSISSRRPAAAAAFLRLHFSNATDAAFWVAVVLALLSIIVK